MFYKRLKQENKELKDMVELLKKQNDEKSEWIKHLIKKSEGQEVCRSSSVASDKDIELVNNSIFGLKSLNEFWLTKTPVSDLPCSTRLRNILKGLMYRNEDQSFKSVFKIYSRRDLQEHRGIGVKLFEELDSMRLEAGIEYKN